MEGTYKMCSIVLAFPMLILICYYSISKDLNKLSVQMLMMKMNIITDSL